MSSDTPGLDGETAAGQDASGSRGLGLDPWIREALRCPVTLTELREEIGPDGELRLVNTSTERPLAYPVVSGVPVLLPDEAIELKES